MKLSLAMLMPLVFVLGTAGPAHAAAGDEQVATRAAHPEAERQAKAILAELATAHTAKARIDLAKKLAAAGDGATPYLKAFLARAHTSTTADRTAVLSGIGAAVPDEEGKFEQPGRLSAKERKAMDELDWLADLAPLPPSPAVDEVIADVAAIRALAASKDWRAATVILDFGFSEAGMVYRDECGRYLRKMAPWSMPALIRAANARGSSSKERYAEYQIERLDREDAFKALADAANENLKIEILRAYQDTRPREAVYAILASVDHPSPAVRKAARAAWMTYATRRAPKAPKRKLELPGGKLSDEEQPLYLTYSELADIELRRTLIKLTGKKPRRGESLKEMSKALFAYYDDVRHKQLLADFSAAKEKAAAGDLTGAIATFDQILVQEPKVAERTEMAPIYADYARKLEADNKFAEAARTYAKAHALAPNAANAADILAAHHRARAKALAQGHDKKAAAAAMERAAEAAKAQAAAETPKKSTWMLYAGGSGAVLAAILFGIGLIRRRQPAVPRQG